MKRPLMSSLALLAVSALLILCLPASAATIYVKWDSPYNGPGNDWDHAYHKVQDGLNAATSGDEVWVARGTYQELITLKDGVKLYGGFAGNGDLRSTSIYVTTLDANWNGNGVTVPAGVTASVKIDGFTIRNAARAINCNGSPIITNNVLTQNGSLLACSRGGGVYCADSFAIITNNIISGNIQGYGGGIYCSGGSPIITNNKITANRTTRTGGGGIYCENSSATVANNLIFANDAMDGGGIYCSSGSPNILNNTIVANTATHYGGAICCAASASPTVTNNIIAFCSSGIYKYAGTGTPIFNNNCVYGNTYYDYSGIASGTGDIRADPKLAAFPYGNFHIQPDSPCRDAGDDDFTAGTFDMDAQARIQGAHVDIGADESDGTMWNSTPKIVRVKTDGNDANDGSTWELAKSTIQAAIDAVASQGGEVWVKAVTYNQRITIRQYVHVYGGFNGTETDKSSRDWKTNITILDGQSKGSVVTVQRSGYMLSTIDGFTIRKGLRTSYGADVGGGIYCSDASPLIANNTLSENKATYGGGIGCFGGTAFISNCSITGNEGSDGGAIACESSSPIIFNNRITANTASKGGGVYCFRYGYAANAAEPIIAGNLITGNTASGEGAGIYCDSYARPTITNNVIVGNLTSGDGGGIYCYEPVPISDNIIAFNSSGICQKYAGGTPQLMNNCVYGNTSYNYKNISPGATDISEDPLFVDRPGGDYHLTPESPCINRGTNSAPGLPLFDMDGEGRICAGTVDIGADELWPATMCIPDAKNAASGALIRGSGAIVSASFDDFFYTEAADRSCGIRVDKADHGVDEGMTVDIIGTLQTNADDERYIAAVSVTPNSTDSVSPVAMNNKALGGGDRCYNPSTGAGQRGITRASDLNNIGLLVTTWGKVIEVDSANPATWFKIDDGSGVGVKAIVSSEMSIGLEEGDYVVVTGISSCEKVNGMLFRLLRVRRQADIVKRN